MSLISHREWKTASECEKLKITEDKFDQETAEQHLRFRERFNTRKEAPTVSSISIKPEDSGIMYPPLPILHQIKAEKYAYSSHDSIKNSPVHGNKGCSLIAASSSNPDSLDVVKFN